MALPEIIKDINARILRSGDTMEGVLGTISGSYADNHSGALNLNNSNVYGVNSIYFADKADNAAEGIHFWRGNAIVDSLWGQDGILYFTPNRPLGSTATTSNVILHTGNFTTYLNATYANVSGDTFTGNVNFNSTINSMMTLTKDTVTSGTTAGNRSLLYIYGTAYGNDTAYIKTAGKMTMGDPGPQIMFGTSSSNTSGQRLSLIYSDHDSIGAGNSLSLVSTESNAWFIAPTIKALTKFIGSLEGNANTASALTNITTNDTASNSEVQRYVFMSYANLTTGRPAYDTRFTFQTSTGLLSTPGIKTNVFNAPTSSGGTTYGPGASGQVLKSNGTTIYWASDNNSDTKVTNTLATTTKFYLTGTSSAATNTGTQYFDTGIYATTTAGQLSANTLISRGAAYVGTNFYLRYGESGTYARIFVSTAGTASATEGTAGTAGVTYMYLGNSTAVSTTAGSGANNSYGILRIYGSSTGYTNIRCGTNNTTGYTLYLPGASGQIVYHTNDTAIGGTRQPIYIAATGAATAITYASTTSKMYVGGVTSSTAGCYYNASVYTSGSVLYGAAWNDYAEYRNYKDSDEIPHGRVVIENGDDSLSLSTKRLQLGGNICSDTFGFAIGETDSAKLPIAVSGRVLAYTNEPRDTYKPGEALCTGPNGTVSKMTREEIKEYPDAIIGYVSAVPDYEVWGAGNVKVDGRIWVKIK